MDDFSSAVGFILTVFHLNQWSGTEAAVLLDMLSGSNEVSSCTGWS